MKLVQSSGTGKPCICAVLDTKAAYPSLVLTKFPTWTSAGKFFSGFGLELGEVAAAIERQKRVFDVGEGVGDGLPGGLCSDM